MPELPEVETIRRQLAPLVEGRRIEALEIRDPRWTRPLDPAELEHALVGRRIERLQRRGKYLLWVLEDEVHLAQHLRMTGAVLADPDPQPQHTRVVISLGAAGTRRAAAGGGGARRGRTLAIVDARRFGTGELLLGEQAVADFFAARLGIEPFDPRFTAEHLRMLARGRAAPVKAMLLDQRRIAGVGNIYADEALFRAGIHPRRRAGTLTREQHARLREAIIAALQAGIDARGATIDDFRHVDGLSGAFQNEFLVYGREGEPCTVCGSAITKMVVAGRGTYVCETCQPRPRAPRRKRAPARGAAG
jgi:formamidopyrimidine-DNA glycosylase